jgi:hypothetical protein
MLLEQLKQNFIILDDSIEQEIPEEDEYDINAFYIQKNLMNLEISLNGDEFLVINEIKTVFCKYQVNGCNYSSNYNTAMLEKHEQTCAFNVQKCHLCQSPFLFSQSKDHEEKCPKMLMECIVCNQRYKRENNHKCSKKIDNLGKNEKDKNPEKLIDPYIYKKISKKNKSNYINKNSKDSNKNLCADNIDSTENSILWSNTLRNISMYDNAKKDLDVIITNVKYLNTNQIKNKIELKFRSNQENSLTKRKRIRTSDVNLILKSESIKDKSNIIQDKNKLRKHHVEKRVSESKGKLNFDKKTEKHEDKNINKKSNQLNKIDTENLKNKKFQPQNFIDPALATEHKNKVIKIDKSYGSERAIDKSPKNFDKVNDKNILEKNYFSEKNNNEKKHNDSFNYKNTFHKNCSPVLSQNGKYEIHHDNNQNHKKETKIPVKNNSADNEIKAKSNFSHIIRDENFTSNSLKYLTDQTQISKTNSKELSLKKPKNIPNHISETNNFNRIKNDKYNNNTCNQAMQTKLSNSSSSTQKFKSNNVENSNSEIIREKKKPYMDNCKKNSAQEYKNNQSIQIFGFDVDKINKKINAGNVDLIPTTKKRFGQFQLSKHEKRIQDLKNCEIYMDRSDKEM